jgi:DNA-binding MarR family transcriptional regulator
LSGRAGFRAATSDRLRPAQRSRRLIVLYMPQSPDSEHLDESELRELDVLAHVHAVQKEAVNVQARTGTRHVSQRSIARALGMSVGLTNAILKRLADKGFLMMRRINERNIHYLVTPSGIEQIGRRSYLYLRRTIGHVVRSKEQIRSFCRREAREGTDTIVLVGESDLTFILEWSAEKEGLRFEHQTRVSSSRRRESETNRVVLAERYIERPAGFPDAALLHEIVLGTADT